MTKEEITEKSPKISLKNSKHSQYDAYMENRGTVDKAKDYIYDIVKGDKEDVKEVKRFYDKEDNEVLLPSSSKERRGVENTSFNLSTKDTTKYSIPNKKIL